VAKQDRAKQAIGFHPASAENGAMHAQRIGAGGAYLKTARARRARLTNQLFPS
jgi:hypothetical protein